MAIQKPLVVSGGIVQQLPAGDALQGLQVGVDIQAYDTNTAKLNSPQSWGAEQTFSNNAALGNSDIKTIKTATFNSQVNNATTTGAVTINWTAGQNQIQAEPTGTITYTFTAPAGPCHLQLLINSDGTSTAQTITWPGSVIWFGATWAGVANKRAVINFWYDGTNYFAQGVNQV